MSFVTEIQDPEKLIGHTFPQIQKSFDQRQAIIYALGIGFNQDPLNQSHFKYTYELNQNFTVFPTYATCLTKRYAPDVFRMSPTFPKLNTAMFLHAQQKLVLVQPYIKIHTSYVTKAKILDIVDKGSMTLILIRSQTFQKSKNQLKLAYYNQAVLAVRKLTAKGFKGVNKIAKLQKVPNRNPDITLRAISYPNQALFYRLAGDFNPLHADPRFAAKVNFEKPILHGLATKGIVARTIVENILNNDSSKLKMIHSRFLGFVFPGQTFEIHVWKMDQKQYVFEATIKERNTKVLSGSFQIRESAKL